MPKKGVKEKQYSSSDMEEAIKKVRAGEMGLLWASKVYSVPRSTLQRMARKIDKPVDVVVTTKLGRHPILNEAIEKDLVKYLLEMESRFFGLTRNDVRSMAFQLALKNKINNPFNILKATAGKD